MKFYLRCLWLLLTMPRAGLPELEETMREMRTF